MQSQSKSQRKCSWKPGNYSSKRVLSNRSDTIYFQLPLGCEDICMNADTDVIVMKCHMNSFDFGMLIVQDPKIIELLAN